MEHQNERQNDLAPEVLRIIQNLYFFSNACCIIQEKVSLFLVLALKNY